MKINQITSLNRQARQYLLDYCISKKGVEIMAFGFTGYINGEKYESITLIRKNNKWQIFTNSQLIQSIKGTLNQFSMTRNTLL